MQTHTHSLDRFVERTWIQILQWLAGSTTPANPRGILRLWPIWERMARQLWPTVDVPGSPYGIFSVHFMRHSGPEFILRDGTQIREGDRVAEIHFNNQNLISAAGQGKFLVLPLFRQELHALAVWMTQADFASDVCAVFGNTLLWRGAARLGFTVRSQPVTTRQRLDWLFLVGLMALYSSEGMGRLDLGRTTTPYSQECWISRTETLRRYLHPVA